MSIGRTPFKSGMAAAGGFVTAGDVDDRGRERGQDGDAEIEPDYRFTLANERTFLAWQRTALGLLAASVAIVRLVPDLTITGTRQVLGILLAMLATITAGAGVRRWRQVDRAVRRGTLLPRQSTPAYLGIGLVVIGLLTLALAISKAVGG
jgi:putative membrane protein